MRRGSHTLLGSQGREALPRRGGREDFCEVTRGVFTSLEKGPQDTVRYEVRRFGGLCCLPVLPLEMSKPE